MLPIGKPEALQSLTPTAEWSLNNNVLEWLSKDVTQPTDAEITAEIEKLQAAYNSKEYARKRKAEYPSIADQLDDIYHNGIDAWKATIKTTKDKYPKE